MFHSWAYRVLCHFRVLHISVPFPMNTPPFLLPCHPCLVARGSLPLFPAAAGLIPADARPGALLRLLLPSYLPCPILDFCFKTNFKTLFRLDQLFFITVLFFCSRIKSGNCIAFNCHICLVSSGLWHCLSFPCSAWPWQSSGVLVRLFTETLVCFSCMVTCG